MNVILHKNNNGDNSITYIAKGYNTQAIQQEIGGVEVSSKIADIKMVFLNAYDIVGNAVNLNLEKARSIKVSIIRKQRDYEFSAFDKRYDIAYKDNADLSVLKQERLKLKDAPQKAEILLDSCINFEEIDAVDLAQLLI